MNLLTDAAIPKRWATRECIAKVATSKNINVKKSVYNVNVYFIQISYKTK
jgi:hypothetical protein